MKFTEEQIKEIEEVVYFAADGKMNLKRVTGSVKGSVLGNVGGSVGGSVWGYVGNNVGGSVWGDVKGE